MEMNMTVVTLFLFPYALISTDSVNTSEKMSNGWLDDWFPEPWIFFAGFGCVIRPTNAVVYVPLFIYQLIMEKKKMKFLTVFVAYL